MNIREFALNLQKVYDDMAETFSSYQKTTGLNCFASCGRCCQNPDIEASPLEMIPFALKVYDEGKLDDWLARLENPEQDYCLLFVTTGTEGKGYCSSYSERPSLCRMFGVSGTFDKHRKVTLSICKYIKENASTGISASDATPMIPLWSSVLATLDPELVTKRLPINLAMREALQKVSLYALYQQI